MNRRDVFRCFTAKPTVTVEVVYGFDRRRCKPLRGTAHKNRGHFSSFAQKLEDPLHENSKPFSFKTPDGYEFFLGMGPLANSDKVLLKGRSPEWIEFLEHPNYDAFWQAQHPASFA